MAQREMMVQIAVVKWLKLSYPKILYCASAGGCVQVQERAEK